MVDQSCQYSFADLYQAAFGQAITTTDRQELYALSQPARNKRVGEWAKKASWQTELRSGSDGINYLAFWPKE